MKSSIPLEVLFENASELLELSMTGQYKTELPGAYANRRRDPKGLESARAKSTFDVMTKHQAPDDKVDAILKKRKKTPTQHGLQPIVIRSKDAPRDTSKDNQKTVVMSRESNLEEQGVVRGAMAGGALGALAIYIKDKFAGGMERDRIFKNIIAEKNIDVYDPKNAGLIAYIKKQIESQHRAKTSRQMGHVAAAGAAAGAVGNVARMSANRAMQKRG